MAARRNKRLVTMIEFEDAKDKVMMGPERRSMVMTLKEKELTAYHEAGHALVGIFTPGNDPLHKVTIIPRGRALGVTMNLPERDRYSETKTEKKAKIAMILFFSKSIMIDRWINHLRTITYTFFSYYMHAVCTLSLIFMYLLFKKTKVSVSLVHAPGNRTPHINEVKKIWKNLKIWWV